MELKINEVQLPEPITFNYKELKQAIEEKAHYYETMVYTEDQMKLAKADKANLNKLKKALNDERIRREREYMQPFMDYKEKTAEIISIIDRPVKLIDEQVKAFEEQKKAEKHEKIRELFENAVFPDWVKFEQVFDARWLNATVSMTSISKELIEKLEKIETDLSALSNLPEYGFEAIQTYKETLDITKALNEAHKRSEMAKLRAKYEEEEKERLEKAWQAEQERQKAEAEAEFAKHMNPPEEAPVKEQREWLGFKAYLTVADAQALANLFATRGIAFEQIKIN